MGPTRVACVVILTALILTGCASSVPAEKPTNANFDSAYETIYKTSSGSDSDVMRTNIRLVYDPRTGQIESAWVGSTGDASARREVRVIPDSEGYVLRLRIFTDMRTFGSSTSIGLEGSGSEDAFYRDLGVTSVNTLVEGVEIVFLGDGGWAVANATGAHLINAGGQVIRRMTSGQDGHENLVAQYP